ncbi:MAG: InlB B-repeat-containing protein [Mogibacterium sp.]|nr:InlB B-repeat-containing protein [Mogibacterium sp.]
MAVEAEAAAEPAKAEAAAEPAKAEEAAEPAKAEVQEEAFDQSKTVDGVTVTVRAAKGVFPAGSELSVSRVAVPSAVDTSDAETAYAFDISIFADGEKIQPDGNAEVSFTTAEVADYDTAVYHMDGGAQQMNVSESGDTATVTTTGFSTYVVTFTLNGTSKEYEYSAETGFTEDIKTLLKELGDTAQYNILLPSTSDPSVVSVDQGQGNPTITTVGEGSATVSIYHKAHPQAQPQLVATITVKVHKHDWKFSKASKLECKIYCSAEDCPYHTGFTTKLDVEDVYHVKDVNVAVNTTPTEGYPDDVYKVGDIRYYEGTIKTVNGFKGKTPVDESIVKSTEGFYTARVIISKWNEDAQAFSGYSNLYRPFQVVSAEPTAAEDLKYNDGKTIIADDGLLPEGTSAVVRYRHPTTDEYVSREELINDGSIPAAKYSIPYVVLASSEDDPEDAIGEGNVEFTIEKADPEVTAPTGKTLTYNGSAQELASAGKTTGGEMQYALGKDAANAPEGGWSASLPKGTEVGKYYVWYKVVGDEIHNDTEPACITSEIVARQFTITYDLNGGKLNGQTGKVSMKVDEGTVITLPAPTRDGYTFDYWEGSKYNAGDKYTVTGDHTFKAVWKTAASGKKGVQTGDSNDIAGLLALMIVSVGTLGAIGYKRRREDHE